VAANGGRGEWSDPLGHSAVNLRRKKRNKKKTQMPHSQGGTKNEHPPLQHYFLTLSPKKKKKNRVPTREGQTTDSKKWSHPKTCSGWGNKGREKRKGYKTEETKLSAVTSGQGEKVFKALQEKQGTGETQDAHEKTRCICQGAGKAFQSRTNPGVT